MKLPVVIDNYIRASNAHDVMSILSCFSEDAVVRDEGETLRGKKAIECWIAKTIEKYKFQFKQLSVKKHDGEVVVSWKSREHFLAAQSLSIITSRSRTRKSCR